MKQQGHPTIMTRDSHFSWFGHSWITETWFPPSIPDSAIELAGSTAAYCCYSFFLLTFRPFILSSVEICYKGLIILLGFYLRIGLQIRGRVNESVLHQETVHVKNSTAIWSLDWICRIFSHGNCPEFLHWLRIIPTLKRSQVTNIKSFNGTILHCSINKGMIQTWLQKLDAALKKA